MTDTKQELFQAIREGETKKVKKLLAKDPALAGTRDENGISAVLWACYHFRPELAEALLAAGPVLDIFEAAAVGRKERVEELLDQHPELANEFSPDGFPLLGYPCFFGQLEVARLLLERGADPNVAARNAMKVHSLNSAASRKRSDIVALLLEHGADVNAAQNMGTTSLHSAAHNGDTETAKLLLARGAEPHPKDDDGKTPLDLAEEAGHDEVVRLLRP